VLRFHSVWRLVALDASTAVVQTSAGASLVTHDGGESWRLGGAT
jgi:photosystem II stability/assembly factor-like uncharacterized protein